MKLDGFGATHCWSRASIDGAEFSSSIEVICSEKCTEDFYGSPICKKMPPAQAPETKAGVCKSREIQKLKLKFVCSFIAAFVWLTGDDFGLLLCEC